MGIIAPNQKKLLIPRKGSKVPSAPVSQSDHDANMRAIEIWANAQAPGGVTQLIAGTNITLDPSDGLGAVTINASGGGGGGGEGIIVLQAGSDSAAYSYTTVHLGPNDDYNSGEGEQSAEFSLFDNSSVGAQHYSFAKSWFTYVNGGESVNFLPLVETPAFTGAATLPIALVMSAQSLDATNMDIESTVAALLDQAPSTSIRYPASDYSNEYSSGGDISFIQGTGTDSGSGQISTGGGAPGSESGLYLCSVQLNVTVPAGTTFS